jgi:hypothetical protein
VGSVGRFPRLAWFRPVRDVDRKTRCGRSTFEDPCWVDASAVRFDSAHSHRLGKHGNNIGVLGEPPTQEMPNVHGLIDWRGIVAIPMHTTYRTGVLCHRRDWERDK